MELIKHSMGHSTFKRVKGFVAFVMCLVRTEEVLHVVFIPPVGM